MQYHDHDRRIIHDHVFLGPSHGRNERRTWLVIALCSLTMLLEIIGGWHYGSIALVADGLHMSTHAGALLLAAGAYTFARRHANDPRFSFGTGKLGDLAGFASAIVLGIAALLIAVESVGRLRSPTPIHFAEAIPIAVIGLVVNMASAWLLSGDHHHHGHGHIGHDHNHASGHISDQGYHHDNNLRAAIVHVAADAVVSMLVIIGLICARAFGWVWIDPAAGLLGAVVIAAWSFGLIKDTGAILLDMVPDRELARHIQTIVEENGGRVDDLHLWRLGPGHLGSILAVTSSNSQDADHYRAKLATIHHLSHLTIEVRAATVNLRASKETEEVEREGRGAF